MTGITFIVLLWLFCTCMLAMLLYSAVLWSVPYVVSDRALGGIRKRAGANVLIHRSPNTADNCRIPMAIADAIVSICVFDVAKCPLKIRATVPHGLYWSISCYARNTENFFVLNDVQASDRAGDELTLVLQKAAHGYRPGNGEILIDAPSNTGIVLIRMVVSDPTDVNVFTQLSRIQRRAYAETVEATQDVTNEFAKFRVDVDTPYDELHVRICHSIEDIEQMMRRDYKLSATIDPSLQGTTIELPGDYRIVFDLL